MNPWKRIRKIWTSVTKKNRYKCSSKNDETKSLQKEVIVNVNDPSYLFQNELSCTIHEDGLILSTKLDEDKLSANEEIFCNIKECNYLFPNELRITDWKDGCTEISSTKPGSNKPSASEASSKYAVKNYFMRNGLSNTHNRNERTRIWLEKYHLSNFSVSEAIITPTYQSCKYRNESTCADTRNECTGMYSSELHKNESLISEAIGNATNENYTLGFESRGTGHLNDLSQILTTGVDNRNEITRIFSAKLPTEQFPKSDAIRKTTNQNYKSESGTIFTWDRRSETDKSSTRELSLESSTREPSSKRSTSEPLLARSSNENSLASSTREILLEKHARFATVRPLENRASVFSECRISTDSTFQSPSRENYKLCEERWETASSVFLSTYLDYLNNRNVSVKDWEKIRQLLNSGKKILQNCDTSLMRYMSDQLFLLFEIETIYISAEYDDSKIETIVRNCDEIYHRLYILFQNDLQSREGVKIKYAFLTLVKILVSKLCKVQILLQKNKERLDICLGYRDTFMSCIYKDHYLCSVFS